MMEGNHLTVGTSVDMYFADIAWAERHRQSDKYKDFNIHHRYCPSNRNNHSHHIVYTGYTGCCKYCKHQETIDPAVNFVYSPSAMYFGRRQVAQQ